MGSLYRRFFLLLLFGLLCIKGIAQSYETSAGVSLNPHFYIRAGAFFPTMNTSMRIDSDKGIGTDISLEDDLKLKSEISAFRVTAIVRLKQRSQFVFSYTDLKRTKTLTLHDDLEFADTTFYANAEANVKFDVNYYALTWRYSFFNETNWNAGLSFGLRMVQFRTGLKATLNNRSYERDPVLTAPALLIGIHGSGYLTPKLLGRYSLEYFQATFSGIKVNVIETQMSLCYYFTKIFGVGGGYATSAFKVRDLPLKNDFTGKVDFSFQGFTLFATARF